VAGGRDGTHNYVEITRPDSGKEVYGKASRIRLHRGDLIRLVTATGAGWGDPKQRDPVLVQADLENGVVTRDEAERVYGLHVGDGGR
jgi:N-methylhydantoinase B